MKERIEKKLGCTLEEYARRLNRKLKSINYQDSEWEPDPKVMALTYEELDFCIDYGRTHDMSVYV